jgi:hypothetical protein
MVPPGDFDLFLRIISQRLVDPQRTFFVNFPAGRNKAETASRPWKDHHCPRQPVLPETASGWLSPHPKEVDHDDLRRKTLAEIL